MRGNQDQNQDQDHNILPSPKFGKYAREKKKEKKDNCPETSSPSLPPTHQTNFGTAGQGTGGAGAGGGGDREIRMDSRLMNVPTYS